MAQDSDLLATFLNAPADRNRHIGRTIRELVDRHLADDTLPHAAFSALADKLDPGYAKAKAEADKLDGGTSCAQ